MSDLGAAKGRIVIDTSDVNRAVNDVRRGSQLMSTALSAIGVGVGFQAVKQLGQIATELANDAAQAQVTREAFNSLASSFGQNADDMLASMRSASRGMISDANLVLDANRAMLLGVADNADKMGKLLDVARVRGQAMGMSLSQAFEDLVTGLGRMSPRILDNLGIVGTQKALDDYAASVGRTADQLSDAQKQAILFNAVVASSQSLIDASAASGDTAAVKFQKMGAKLENTKQKFGEFLLAAGATDTLDTFATAIDNSITQLQTLDNWLTTLKTDLNSFGESTGLSKALEAINVQLERWDAYMGHLGFQIGTRSTDPYSKPNLGANSGGGGGGGGFGGGSGRGSSGPIPVPASEVDRAAVLDAQVQYGKELADITRRTNRDIQQATEDAGRQRAETVRSYELSLVREEEDFQRQRARAQRDYENSVVQIMRDAQKRETRIRTDLDEQVADLRKDSNKRIAEQEAAFQKQRERAARDHGDKLMDAAGRLDARAVYEEQRRYAEQQQDAEEDHKERLDQDAENLAERIAQAQKAAERQLQDARDADAERLADMRADFAQRLADEDADRQTRRERAAEDYQHQLDEQAIQAGLRLQQIQENAADQRMALQDAFAEQLTDAGLFNTAYHNKQLELQQQYLNDLEPFMRDWYNLQIDALNAAKQQALFPNLPKAILPTVSGSYPSASASSLGGASISRSTSMGQIVVNINGTNLNETQLEGAIVKALTKVLEEHTP